jgi:hypothetical protein
MKKSTGSRKCIKTGKNHGNLKVTVETSTGGYMHIATTDCIKRGALNAPVEEIDRYVGLFLIVCPLHDVATKTDR